MSNRGQPLLIATVNYHVGHTMSIRVAQEQGYFREEGLADCVFESAGLVPGPFERDALALAMEEHGVDIAVAVKLSAALYQRSRGADLCVVGGWRIDGPAGTKWYGRAGVRTPAELRSGRIGIRERGSMDEEFLSTALRLAGVDPRDVTWVCDPIFYANHDEQFDALGGGRVDLIPCQPNQYAEAERRGLALVVDTTALFPAGRPGKVIVATQATLNDRAAELEAFLRANIRAFWYCRNEANFEALRALDAALRVQSHNAYEHNNLLVTSRKMMSGWSMPLDGGIPRDALASIIDDLEARGELAGPLDVSDVYRDTYVRSAYRELAARPALEPDLERNAALLKACGY